MSHGALICRSCFDELELKDARGRSGTERGGPVCPNCGSESFGI